ncbi:MAG TPA: CRISPR-associated endonuclease Cas2 [Smithellaceae bacterium]|jgi:CRISPR-associated protein Cas2|nr:CRISPR-associated endonuclease Cas2 [Syntrophaceae bacterium]HPI52631.1 CRISPR-associated endonuclease Cas2 [Smithellaceae bacterium]MBP9532398.1 CRISPR-associated endonuclease Cas2 [Syntrophaceae bacterium]HPY07675.1 CRISPR-associated endonuclease Cas2 [Smithellaceae bacterium]HQC11437.1 CRISPR-associated endonuclease Cas2 [Smithellaceae bacterium]
MITLITYDITDPKRLNDLRKFLKEFGLRTQRSVFECDIDDDALKRIRAYCRANLNIAGDSVRIYKICNRCVNKVVISGTGLKVAQLDYMIV